MAISRTRFSSLFVPERVGWNDRKHFFAMAAQAMRQILVSHARSKNRVKRGGDRARVEMDTRMLAGDEPNVDILDLDEVLGELQDTDERQARIVELRFFGGLEVQEVAELLDLSKSTVEREWRAARAWLGLRLEGWVG